MPLYDYDCAACGRRFEAVHGVHADGPTSCPLCGKGPVRKAITAPAVHYKGSGWAKKERRATSSSATSKSSGDGAGGDGSGRDGANHGGNSTSDGSSKSETTSSSEGNGAGSASPAAKKPTGTDAAKTTD
jgi:putative FmdB family regulatory protein